MDSNSYYDRLKKELEEAFNNRSNVGVKPEDKVNSNYSDAILDLLKQAEEKMLADRINKRNEGPVNYTPDLISGTYTEMIENPRSHSFADNDGDSYATDKVRSPKQEQYQDLKKLNRPMDEDAISQIIGDYLEQVNNTPGAALSLDGNMRRNKKVGR